MIDRRKKKQDNKNRIGSVAAGVAGAVVIAGVAVAATVALKDEKTRKKVKKVLINVKDQTVDYVDALKTDPNAVKGTHAIKKIARDTKKL